MCGNADSELCQWEVEELACVENYLWSLLSDSFDRIEHSFVGIQLPEPPLNDSELTSCQSHNRSAALREAKFQIHSLYKDYLSNLSLPFLRHALRLDRLNMQREMSSHIYYDGQKRSLSTALEGFWREISGKESNLINNYIHEVAYGDGFHFKDRSDCPNQGWLCVYGHSSLVSPYAIRHTTHSLGYVFWDCRRLSKSFFLGPMYV